MSITTSQMNPYSQLGSNIQQTSRSLSADLKGLAIQGNNNRELVLDNMFDGGSLTDNIAEFNILSSIEGAVNIDNTQLGDITPAELMLKLSVNYLAYTIPLYDNLLYDDLWSLLE